MEARDRPVASPGRSSARSACAVRPQPSGWRCSTMYCRLSGPCSSCWRQPEPTNGRTVEAEAEDKHESATFIGFVFGVIGGAGGLALLQWFSRGPW